MWRAIAAGVSVVVAAGTGLVINLVTADRSLGLWAALGALLLLGVFLQVAVSIGERRPVQRVAAVGTGSVAVGGSAGEVRTHVHGRINTTVPKDTEGVIASGPGAVGIGGNARGPLSTNVTEPDNPATP